MYKPDGRNLGREEKTCRIQIQVSAGLFVPLFAHLTRAPTLNSEFPQTHEYNIVYTVKSQKVLGDYQCLLRITFTRRKSTGPFSTMG